MSVRMVDWSILPNLLLLLPYLKTRSHDQFYRFSNGRHTVHSMVASPLATNRPNDHEDLRAEKRLTSHRERRGQWRGHERTEKEALAH